MNEARFLEIIKRALGAYPLSPTIAEVISFIFKNRYESMAIVNRDGEVEFLDRFSELYFDLPHGAAKGRHIKDIISTSGLPEVAQSETVHMGRVFDVRGRHRIVSRFPIYHENRLIGAFGRVILHSFEELERVQKQAEKLKKRLNSAEKKVHRAYGATYSFENILGVSKQMKEIVDMAMRMSKANVDVLLQGESGTGKELFAHAMHNASQNRLKPFVKVNCPAIPIELAESELFGFQKGAFTGAKADHQGKFELAQGGSIFLDEISSLPLSIQAKLLRVIQEREIERIGGQRLIPLKFRLIAATNSPLEILSERGEFRSDLYYRLSSAVLRIPPLRDRPEDIPVMVEKYLPIINTRLGTDIRRVSSDAMRALSEYRWPGNVRELFNVVEQSMFQTDSSSNRVLHLEDLPAHLKDPQAAPNRHPPLKGSLRESVQDLERETIASTLRQFAWNKKRTAEVLGIPRSVLYVKIEKYGIEKEGSRPS